MVLGYNNRGQLGDGTTTNRTAPVQVGTGSNWSSVNTGDAHTCAVRTDGTLWCWGFNRLAQLGIGSSDWYRTAPAQVGTGTTWSGVAAGFAHICAICTDGSLWCWGDNSSGQLGSVI